MKQVAQLDANGYFCGFTVADESPLEPGVFLLPANTVDAQLPEIPNNKRAKWDGEWVIQELPQIKLEPEFSSHTSSQVKQNSKVSVDDLESVSYWVYDDILTPSACDSIINTYTQENIKTELPIVGNDSSLNIDANVRSVEIVSLPTYKDIGARLAAAGFDANHSLDRKSVV